MPAFNSAHPLYYEVLNEMNKIKVHGEPHTNVKMDPRLTESDSMVQNIDLGGLAIIVTSSVPCSRRECPFIAHCPTPSKVPQCSDAAIKIWIPHRMLSVQHCLAFKQCHLERHKIALDDAAPVWRRRVIYAQRTTSFVRKKIVRRFFFLCIFKATTLHLQCSR